MSRFQMRRRAGLCTLLSAVLVGHAAAQAPAAPAGLSDAERAKRDAEKVFQWIRIHSDKPRKAAPAAPPAAADKPQAAAAPRTVARPARPDGITETVRELPAAVPRQDTAARPAEVPLAAAPAALPTSPAVDASAPLAAAPAVEEDVVLTPVLKTEPEFPGSLMRQLRKGLVQVGFTVRPDGSVTQVHAVSSTHPRLVAAAVSTVAQWKFQPLRQPQQAVVDLGFNLD